MSRGHNGMLRLFPQINFESWKTKNWNIELWKIMNYENFNIWIMKKATEKLTLNANNI